MTLLCGVIIYSAIVLGIICFSSYKNSSSSIDFFLGNRSLNPWLTALAAHASDMSNWLFMGYPALIFLQGAFHSWLAVGLVLFMFFNWQFIAPKLRALTNEMDCSTLSAFFEKKVKDHTPITRIFSAVICIIFYMIYIAAGLVGIGHLINSLFGLSYFTGLIIGVCIVFSYVLIGGYKTLAYLDFFQGLFLIGIIIFVPMYIVFISKSSLFLENRHLLDRSADSLFPNFSISTFFKITSMILGWGLGYFGQPHILTKFMGIKQTKMIQRSKYIGLSWMSMSLIAATAIGLIGSTIFKNGLLNPELIFIDMIKITLSPLLIGLVLCTLIGAIFNVVSAQILVLLTIIVEDLYKPFTNKKSFDREFLFVSRIGSIFIAVVSCFVAFSFSGSIYSLVLYAWSGLGASFGPTLIYLLYSNKVSKEGAWLGMAAGSFLTGFWPYINTHFKVEFSPLPPAFLFSLLCNWSLTVFINRKKKLMLAKTHSLTDHK